MGLTQSTKSVHQICNIILGQAKLPPIPHKNIFVLQYQWNRKMNLELAGAHERKQLRRGTTLRTLR